MLVSDCVLFGITVFVRVSGLSIVCVMLVL